MGHVAATRKVVLVTSISPAHSAGLTAGSKPGGSQVATDLTRGFSLTSPTRVLKRFFQKSFLGFLTQVVCCRFTLGTIRPIVSENTM
jgi:hypothetical protein